MKAKSSIREHIFFYPHYSFFTKHFRFLSKTKRQHHEQERQNQPKKKATKTNIIHSETQGEGRNIHTKAMKTEKTQNEFASRLVLSFSYNESTRKGKTNTYGEGFDDAISSASKITENIFDWAIVHCANSIHCRFFVLVLVALYLLETKLSQKKEKENYRLPRERNRGRERERDKQNQFAKMNIYCNRSWTRNLNFLKGKVGLLRSLFIFLPWPYFITKIIIFYFILFLMKIYST